MFRKEWKLLFRDWGQVLVLFVMPIMFIVVMGTAMKDLLTVDSGTTPLPVLNLDRGDRGQQLVDLLREDSTLEVLLVETAEDRAGVEEQIRNGKLEYALIIPADFSDRLEEGEGVTLHLVSDPGAPAQRLLPARSAASGRLEQLKTVVALRREVRLLVDRAVDRTVREAVAQAVDQTLAEVREQVLPALPPPVREQVAERLSGIQPAPVAAEVEPQEEELTVPPQEGQVEVAFPPGMAPEKAPDTYQTNVPGYTITFMFFIAASIATSVLAERDGGTLRRVLCAPVRHGDVLVSKVVPYYVINLLQAGLIFGLARLVFGMSLGDQPWVLAVISAALALAATGTGLILASLVRTQGQVNGVVPLVSLTMAALGGCLVPLQLMPRTMQTLSLFTPHGWALRAYQDVLVRGYGLQEVTTAVAVLAAFGVAAVAIGIRLFRTV